MYSGPFFSHFQKSSISEDKKVTPEKLSCAGGGKLCMVELCLAIFINIKKKITRKN